MKIYLFPAVAAVAVMLCAVTFGPADAADSTFSVDSYIPQKFTDFQLRLDGGLHIEGEKTEHAANSFAGDLLREQNESYNVEELRLAGKTTYRYETIPRYLNLTLSAAGYGTNINGYYRQSADWPSQFKKGVQSSFDVGAYLASDFLFSITGDGAWDYGGIRNNDATSHGRTYATTIEILPGWGRMYEGEYAATGMYIVNELRHNEILLRDPNYEEMIQLTQLVHHYRQTHAIDERLYRIEALTKIMKYLQEIGAIEDIGPYGYLLIQDVWDYYPTFSRRFGHRLRAGTCLRYSYASNDSTMERVTDGRTTYHRYNHREASDRAPYLVLLWEWQRPFGLRWQIDLEERSRFYFDRHYRSERVNVNYVSGSIQPLETVTEYRENRYVHLAGTMRYILDSRTNAQMTTSYDITHYHSQTTQRGTPT